MKKTKSSSVRNSRPLVLLLSENDVLASRLSSAFSSLKHRVAVFSDLSEFFEAARERDVAAVVIDTVVQYLSGQEIGDALRAVTKRIKVVALRERKVGRPQKKTRAGTFLLPGDTDPEDIAAVAATPPRGRRGRFSKADAVLEKLLEAPLAVSRKRFLEAADAYYMKASIQAASSKPRLAAALGGDSLASAYRLLEEYGIPYGLNAGARPCRRKSGRSGTGRKTSSGGKRSGRRGRPRKKRGRRGD